MKIDSVRLSVPSLNLVPQASSQSTASSAASAFDGPPSEAGLRPSELGKFLTLPSMPMGEVIDPKQLPAYEYTVKRGDTLTAIGERFQVYPQILAESNGISDPNRIVTGTPLNVAGWKTYTVQPGDTLSGIAAALSVPAADLVRANQIKDPNRIIAGQALAVPDVSAGNALTLKIDAVPTPFGFGKFVGYDSGMGQTYAVYEKGTVHADDRNGTIAGVLLPGSPEETPKAVVDTGMYNFLRDFRGNDHLGDHIYYEFANGTVDYSVSEGRVLGILNNPPQM